MKSIKEKIYHKLINNELRYNTKSIVRYGKNSNKNIVIANYNAPNQIVLSGDKNQIDEASVFLKKNGTKRIFNFIWFK